MTRSIRAVAATAILAGGLSSAGCAWHPDKNIEDFYRNAFDVSWPERYNYAARESTLASFAQQSANGHFLDQTIWNWHFEPGTDKLNAGGIEKLDTIARATPAPDPKVFIQTARDIAAGPDNVDRLIAVRDELNAKRAAAVKKYMATQPGIPAPYEVFVHDAPVPGIYSLFTVNSFRSQRIGYVGGLTGAGGGGAAQQTGGGATPGSGAPAGGSAPSGGSPGGSGGTQLGGGTSGY